MDLPSLYRFLVILTQFYITVLQQFSLVLCHSLEENMKIFHVDHVIYIFY